MKIPRAFASEVWSKETTRRALYGFGIVVFALFVGFRVLQVVQRSWLTPGEREVGRVVLTQIDALQNLGSVSREDFDARAGGLADNLRKASDEVWTSRDRGVYSRLSLYLLTTESKHRDEKQVQQSDPSTTPSERELNRKAEKESKRLLRLWLHNQLD
jgi:hypothetical protein